jgi:L-ascorbate metabolism protein UlaG (beta-lactamase superfamily)
MKFTYYGHACFSLTINNEVLLFDPFITPNELAKDINLKDIKADYILISHGHEDHIADAVTLAHQTNATIITNWEIAAWLNNKGVTNTHPMNTGGCRTFSFGQVRCVVAQHSSSLPDGSYGGNPMGFIISANDKNIYYTGDTALTLDMQLVPIWGNVDAIILPIGDNFTMGYNDAAKCCNLINCNKAIAVHFDTFGYIKINHEEVKQHFAENQIDINIPVIGSSYEIQ